jgi:hypothetical protein
MLAIFTRRGLSRLLVCCSLLSGSVLTSVALAAPECPYEATVRTSEVEVRSGPGQRYYVTGRVKQNEPVTVVRHDPGGWFMIVPPAGSFSYIDATVVRKTGDATGVIELPAIDAPDAKRAIVRIGSEFGDDYSYYGRELAHGDEVRILGEKMLNTDQGAVRMYRIAPPPLEYRWVKGDFIVAVGETLPSTPLAGAFTQPVGGFAAATPAATTPATPVTKPVETDPFAGPFRPQTATTSATPTTLAAPPRAAAMVSGSKEALSQLDLKYIELLQQTPEHWDLDTLVSDYKALQLYADGEMAAQIDDRLANLESRRKVWEDYQAFVRLTTETSQRDAELQAMQSGGIQQVSFDPAVAGPQGTGVTPIGTTVPGDAGPTLGGVPPGAAGPVPANANPPAAPSVNPSSQAGTPGVPQFDGAGIVQRMQTGRRGQFAYVLADPQGRVLSVLQAPPGLNLESYVGRSLGVVGQRFYDPRLRSDVINIRQVLPVQLAPAAR